MAVMRFLRFAPGRAARCSEVRTVVSRGGVPVLGSVTTAVTERARSGHMARDVPGPGRPWGLPRIPPLGPGRSARRGLRAGTYAVEDHVDDVLGQPLGEVLPLVEDHPGQHRADEEVGEGVDG